MNVLPIKDWAAEDRPTYKLENDGVRNLSTCELLSIIIGQDCNNYNSMDIARNLLASFDNSLSKIASSSVVELCKYEGIGKATARKILAALDIGRRRMEDNNERQSIDNPTIIYDNMHKHFIGLEVEEFWMLCLNQNYKLLKKVRISQGGITETAADIRIVMKEALLLNTTVLAVCHNHPSGNTRPSKDDDRLTERIKKACEIMRIYFLDHVIIGDNSYYSYHEQGRI